MRWPELCTINDAFVLKDLLVLDTINNNYLYSIVYCSELRSTENRFAVEAKIT